MPRIPDIPLASAPRARATGRGIASALRVGQAVSEFGETVSQLALDFHERRVKAELNRVGEAKMLDLTRKANELQLEADLQEPLEAASFFERRFGEAVEESLSDVGNEILRDFIVAQSGRLGESKRFQVQQRSFDRQRRLEAQTIQEGIQVYENEYAEATDEFQRDIALEGAARLIDGSTFLSPAEKEEAREAVPLGFLDARIRQRIRTGQFEEAGSLIQASGLDQKTKLSLQNALEAQQSQVRQEQRRLELEAQEALVKDWNVRIFDQDPNTRLTVEEILASDVPPSVQRVYIGLLSRVASGTGLGTNWTLYSDLLDAIRIGEVTHSNQLIPFLNRGLGVKEFNQLDALLDEFRNEETRPAAEALSRWVSAQKRLITGSNALIGKDDATGDSRFGAFQVETRKLWKNGLERGVNPWEMLDPNSKEYIGRILPAFVRPAGEIGGFRIEEGEELAETVRRMLHGSREIPPEVAPRFPELQGPSPPEPSAPIRPIPVPTPFPAPPVFAPLPVPTREIPTPGGGIIEEFLPQRLPGETPAEYKRRIGR